MGEFTRRRVVDHVRQVPCSGLRPGASRVGTVHAKFMDLCALFGKPVDPGCSDGKVTKVWTFSTPRGEAQLRDYWWNSADEWSVGSTSFKAGKWLARYVEMRLEQNVVCG